MSSLTFGPWAGNLDEPERRARLRAMRAIAHMLARSHFDLIAALREAETEPAALGKAAEEIDRLPALTRRHLLASYASVAR